MGKVGTSEKKKGGRGFRVALLVMAAVNVVGIAAVLCGLWQRLETYETDSPVTALNAFFTAVEEGRTDDIVTRLVMKGQNTAADYAAWLRKTYPGKTADYRYAPLEDATSPENEGKRYAVYDGGVRRGEVRLYSADGESGPWTVQPEVTYLPAYTVRAPAFARVLLNGRPLPEACRAEKSEPVPLFDTQRDAARIPQMAAYVVSDLLEEPVFTAETPAGQACLVSLDEKTRTVTVRAAIADEELKACMEQIETAAKLYARYISQDAAFSKLAALVYKDTDFYDAVRAYDGKYYNKHTAYAFEKFAVTGVERFSEDTFAGDVSFDYVVSRTHDTHTYPTKYRVAFQKIDGRYRLVDLRIQ